MSDSPPPGFLVMDCKKFLPKKEGLNQVFLLNTES
jgi:hypothetical protein